MKVYYTYAEIDSKIKKIIADEFGGGVHTLNLNTSLKDDLDLDSLDAVELVLAVEDQFEIDISDDDSDKMHTVGDVINFVCQRLNVAPQGQKVIEGFFFRSAIEQRAIYYMTVNGFVGLRWDCVKEWLYVETGGNPKTKKGKKAVKLVQPEIITTLPDDKLLDLYEMVVRQYSKQM